MSLPITQRCARCGESWWDAHICPKADVFVAKPLPGRAPAAPIDWPVPAPSDAEVLRLQRDQLAAALRKVLDTRDAEAKAQASYENATDNFTDSQREQRLALSTMVAASDAEKEARLLLLTLNLKL